jgi:hypothetical protein
MYFFSMDGLLAYLIFLNQVPVYVQRDIVTITVKAEVEVNIIFPVTDLLLRCLVFRFFIVKIIVVHLITSICIL